MSFGVSESEVRGLGFSLEPEWSKRRNDVMWEAARYGT